MAEHQRILFCPREPPTLRPDVASDRVTYQRWLKSEKAARRATPCTYGENIPEIGVLIATGGKDAVLLEATLGSLSAQTTSKWRAFVAGTKTQSSEHDYDGVESAYSRHPKISFVAPTGSTPKEFEVPTQSSTVPADLSLTLEACDSQALMILCPGDVLATDALYLLAGALREADLAYADEDSIDQSGAHVDPILKPDWSPDLLMSTPYVGRPYALWKSLLVASGAIAPYPGTDWEHDLLLRLSEHSSRISHLPAVLCHRVAQTHTGPEPRSMGPSSLNAPKVALERRGEDALVEPGPIPRSWYIRRRLDPDTSIDIVVAFRDGAQFLRNCVDSVVSTSDQLDVRLVLVDNATTDPETLSLMERLEENYGVTLVHDPRPFNWAELNNNAVKYCSGEVVVFLNNDIETRTPGWLQALVSQALRREVGASGARLLYPNGLLQHAGVVIGMGGAAGHVLCGLPATSPGYLGMAVLTRDTTAVTGACLATRRSVFEELGGFDDTLGLDLNDIDYCLRAREAGYRIVYEPLAELVHHESPSRGTSGSVEDIGKFIDRWEHLLLAGDPHLNSNLTRLDCSCALRDDDEERWWLNWRSTLNSSRIDQDRGPT